MIDGPSKVVVLEDEARELLVRVEEDVVLLLSVDNVGALIPFLREHSL